MSIFVTLETTVKQNVWDRFKVFLEENLQNVRGFNGALNVSILFNEETNGFLIHEEWLSQDHHQDYLRAITDNGIMAQLLTYLENPPKVSYYSKQVI